MQECGLIILGNSGVGKSFLANIVLGREIFKHGISVDSITRSVESEKMVCDNKSMVVLNIPGLIEAEQERIISNKQEIDKAFALQPNSIVMFVFGQQNGRPKSEDISAFEAINKVYSFKRDSLLLVINQVSKDNREPNYKGKSLTFFQKQLQGVDVHQHNLLILDHITIHNSVETERLQKQIIEALIQLQPKKHEKTGDIETLMDQLKKTTTIIDEQKAQFEVDRQNYKNEIEENQRKIEDMEAKQRQHLDLLDKKYQQQVKELIEQIRTQEEQNQKTQKELQELRRQSDQARVEYQQACQRDKSTEDEIQATRREYKEFEVRFNKLSTAYRKQDEKLRLLQKQQSEQQSIPSWIQKLFAMFSRTSTCPDEQ